MVDREKVIKGLECCAHEEIGDCENCPYNENTPHCDIAMMRDALALLKSQKPIIGETSDGYHTFNELYHHRAVLFSVIVANYPDRTWKSKKHHDGTMYDNMFIVGIDTPDGQATYHYDVDPYWDMFKCRVLDNAPEWDGHTPAQAIERIGKLKAQDIATIQPKRIELADDTKAWLDEMDAVDALGNIADICIDWDGYRTANELGGLVNEIRAYARYCADRLAKAQEPHVMKVGDVRKWVNSDRVTREPVVIEIRGGVCAWIIDDEVREIPGNANLSSDLYGKTWRCWTSRPGEKRSAETLWN